MYKLSLIYCATSQTGLKFSFSPFLLIKHHIKHPLMGEGEIKIIFRLFKWRFIDYFIDKYYLGLLSNSVDKK